MRRLHFLIPDAEITERVVKELLLAGIPERQIHIVAKDHELLQDGQLPEAGLLEEPRVVPAIEKGLAAGGAAGLLAGLVAVTFPPAGLALGGGALLGAMLGGAAFGALVGPMIGIPVPNRDTVRRFWKGDDGQLAELASRMAGSSDLFDRRGRRPWGSTNFVTAHDGFTLQDLVSFNSKYNEANREDSRDGSDNNSSWNCGVEGPSDDAQIIALRERQKRNLLATRLLSQGLPMLLAGDGFGHGQGGNNNAYCQDNETTWLDWQGIDAKGKALLAFTKILIGLRREHSVFHRHRFFHGNTIPGTRTRDIVWLRPDGEAMRDHDWHAENASSIALFVSGEAGRYHLTTHGEKETDDSFMLMLNAAEHAVDFAIPDATVPPICTVVIDTADEAVSSDDARPVASPCRLESRALMVLKCCHDD